MSDAVLVAAIRHGDHFAFAALYRAHVGAVARVVRDNVHNAEAVADVVQEVFARALERLSTLRDADRFRPWLLSIARNAAIDYRRSLRHVPGTLPGGDSEPSADEPGPAELVELRELAQLVEGCVAGLSTRDATALSLVMHLGFSPTDIAGAMGLSVGAAKVLVHRARQRLRDALALELMVRRRAAGCDTLASLVDANALVDAARHVRSCEACAGAVHDAVSRYSVPPPITSSSRPSPRSPSRTSSA